MKSFLSFVNSKLPYESVAIGKFDGMHKAHQHIFGLLGDNGCALSIATTKPPFITPPQEREHYASVPFFRLRFERIKVWDSEQFLELLCLVLPNLKRIIVGYDFCFGRGRMHTASDLQLLLNRIGKSHVHIDIVMPQKYNTMPIHTSIIKELLLYGDIGNANAMLGRFYQIKGRVVRGQGIGTTLLYPTINIQTRLYFIPKYGVYASFVLHGDTCYESVSFIGNRLSTDKQFCIETHILNTSLHVNHGESIRIFFVQYLRDNRRFPSLDMLKTQIQSDIASAQEILQGHTKPANAFATFL